jgi:malonyl-CoA O-methyltransferase
MAERDIIQCPTVAQGCDLWAPVYDHDANPLVALEEPIVAAALGEVAGLRVLDLGCGTGRHALRLAAAGASVTALDLSPGMLREARAKAGPLPIDFRLHDLTRPLPFPDGVFDLAVSGLVLEHLEDLDGFFRELRRVLKPGGRAVVSAMHPSMFLKGTQAHFHDPATGAEIRPGSLPHPLGAFIMAALRAGLELEAIQEVAPDEAFVQRWPRAKGSFSWPMLVVLEVRR